MASQFEMISFLRIIIFFSYYYFFSLSVATCSAFICFEMCEFGVTYWIEDSRKWKPGENILIYFSRQTHFFLRFFFVRSLLMFYIIWGRNSNCGTEYCVCVYVCFFVVQEHIENGLCAIVIRSQLERERKKNYFVQNEHTVEHIEHGEWQKMIKHELIVVSYFR